MERVRDIPRDAALITDSQELEALSKNIGYELQPEFGCVFVLSSFDGDIMAVWACESNVPVLTNIAVKIPLS